MQDVKSWNMFLCSTKIVKKLYKDFFGISFLYILYKQQEQRKKRNPKNHHNFWDYDPKFHSDFWD